MIAVNVDRPGTERSAIEILRRHGARDVRRAEGQLARTAPGATSTRAPRSPPSSSGDGPRAAHQDPGGGRPMTTASA